MMKLSLNSADPDCRRQLTGNNHEDKTAIQAPGLLQKHGIPFLGSIVAWPLVFPDDMIDTLHYLDRFEPYALKVRLPLYHRFLHKKPPFKRDFWNRVLQLCAEIQNDFKSPLFCEPSLYWIKPVVPVVDGVILNSPASVAGIASGDQLVSIDGEPVYTRTHAAGLLELARRKGNSRIKVHFNRPDSEETLSCTLCIDAGSYPFNASTSSPYECWGILLLDDFRLSYIENIMRIIKLYDARRPLLFSSPVVAPIARTVIRGIPHFRSFFKTHPLNIRVLNKTLTGGNMHLLDGKFVADFIDYIDQMVAKKSGLPDLLMIPNAFGNPWGVDLMNQSYIEIERRFKIPVEMVDWPILYGKDV
jgi:membrane-associated protease RseP (regulator of RpoE activity)